MTEHEDGDSAQEYEPYVEADEVVADGDDAAAEEVDSGPIGIPPEPVDRQVVIHDWAKSMAGAALRVILVAIALGATLWLLGKVWVGVLPIVMALIVTTVLWPAVAWMRAHRIPASLAALIGILIPFLAVGGIISAMAPSVARQSSELVDEASKGLLALMEWVQGPPVNLRNEQVEEATKAAVEWMQGSSSQIAEGVFTTVGAVTSALITTVLMLVLTFFFLKDGPNFLPWIRKVVGRNAGRHVTEASTRAWKTLGGFIRTQAIVSLVDAFFIGLGLVLLQVPLAFALALLTFFAGFIPIVGAVSVGALAVLVALVGVGWKTAIAVLVIIVVVQQVESNLLQPYLQGKSMQLHAGIILLAVALGGTLFGIIGAFLAVPAAAVLATLFRYASEQVDLRTGDLLPDDVFPMTPEGAEANRMAAAKADHYRAIEDGEKPDLID